MTSPNEFPDTPPTGRPVTFDDWLQAFREQASFFTGLKFGAGVPRWPLSEVLPVLPFIGALVGLIAGLVFAIVRGISGPGWLAAALAVGAAVLATRALHEDGLADTADGLGRMRWSRRGGSRSCATAATAPSASWRSPCPC
jgi:adenosylcobinamide-GDP ribazoletransferase